MNTQRFSVPMTLERKNQIQHELNFLKTEARTNIAKALMQASAEGDRSENGAYTAAREEQGRIERRIAQLTLWIQHAEIVDTTKLSGDRVMFGAYVTLRDDATQHTAIYKITGPADEDDTDTLHCASISSLMGRSMIGRQPKDIFEIITPKGNEKSYTILAVSYTQPSSVPHKSHSIHC